MKLYLLFTIFASKNDKKSNNDKETSSNKRDNRFGRIYFDIINSEEFKNLSGAAVKIYVAMLKFADWKSGRCYPSQRTLADICDYNRTYVNEKIKELIDNGLIRKESDRKSAPIYHIIAYEEHLVDHSLQGVDYSRQGVSTIADRGVDHSRHEQDTVTKINNDNQQQQNNLEDGDLIRVTSSVGEPETVESVCCRISSLFSKKFHTELPARFIKEKINPGEVFDDQFYIKIIQTQQKMPDNPIGWWRSIDSTWVIDENARPVDSVGRGWQIRTTTVDVNEKVEQEKKLREEEEKLRAEAEKLREQRLSEAVLSFPSPDEYTKKRVQEIINVRNMLVEDSLYDKKPYTSEEIAVISEEVRKNYPQTDEEKRKRILFNSKGEYDVEKIMEELREKRRLEKSKSV